MIFTVAPGKQQHVAFREKGQCREQAPGERQLTEHMIITDQGHPKQVCYGFPSGAVLLVTNGGIFQKAVATASNQTKKKRDGQKKNQLWSHQQLSLFILSLLCLNQGV